MTRARSQLVSLEATPYYHCISRCVRRAFLCGDDHYSGQNFDHRKPWLINRLKLLTDIFSIDIAAYAVMSNHYHLVLHIDKGQSEQWSRDEVIARWRRLYKGPPVVQRYLAGDTLMPAELHLIDSIVEIWRKRLASISWFMGSLNEYIARRANKEDHCKGRFWEGRFKSQALLDETALISCMAYVDLNPVRARISPDLQSSDFTSIQKRLRGITHQSTKNMPRLMPFQERQRQNDAFQAIPFNLKDYVELVDWTGRHVRADKRGYISAEKPRLLELLRLSEAQWQTLALDVQKRAILTLNGLDVLARLEKQRQAHKRAA